MDLKTTDQSFADDVLKSNLPVLVDFRAPWCEPCRMAGPIIDSVAGKMQGKAKVYKLNVDENPLTSSEYRISGIPTVLIFKDGSVRRHLVGVQQESVYLDALA